MKKIVIIFLLIVVAALVYFTWDFIQFKNLQTDNIEKEKVEQLALKTIDSIHSGNIDFINNISKTDKVKNILLDRMKILKSSKYENAEVIEIRAERKDFLKVVVLFSNDLYKHLEYTFIFKKEDNVWKITDFTV